jgi:predicted ATP-grasp superfamily ATP-dependent carboligase
VSELIWHRRPELDQPVVIAAFEGWNDAGDAASAAIRHLIDVWQAERFASIDPEEFYDFTTHRPSVRLTAEERREIDWPENTFWSASAPGSGDVVLLIGTEPSLRWRTFCDQVLEVAEATSARLIVTVGALLADVPHSRPATAFGTAYDSGVIDEFNLERSLYQGPTGIVGVLHHACSVAGLRSASLWAAVPSYVAEVPSPKAQHALVERIGEMLGAPISLADLQARADEYTREISDLVAEDADTAAYVRHLEEAHDRDREATGGLDDLVAELEEYLREQ